MHRYSGSRLLEAELEEDDDLYVYEVELLTRVGQVRELEFDAASGPLLKDEGGRLIRLLLVEDNVALADELLADLGRQGYAVDWLADGRDALVQGATEPYDLIVLDLGLPGMPGLEVLRRWRADALRTPVLILTARDSWAERIDGLKAGADDYLEQTLPSRGTGPAHPGAAAPRPRAGQPERAEGRRSGTRRRAPVRAPRQRGDQP